MELETRRAIRQAYKTYSLDMGNGFRRSAYDLGIEWEFTPIEFNVWGDIRSLGLPLYPQYPVGPYFVDFGDPKRKIAIEVDSVAWHRDKEKDSKREHAIKELGWHVFRISSFATFRDKEEFIDEDDVLDHEKFVLLCSEGILTDIYDRWGYFDQKAR